jgi:hypothetical protein
MVEAKIVVEMRLAIHRQYSCFRLSRIVNLESHDHRLQCPPGQSEATELIGWAI